MKKLEIVMTFPEGWNLDGPELTTLYGWLADLAVQSFVLGIDLSIKQDGVDVSIVAKLATDTENPN